MHHDALSADGTLPGRAGIVEAVGAGVTHVKAGDRVAYAGGGNGAYSEVRVMPAGVLVKLPEAISFEQGAAMMLQGMTVQYLIKQSYPVKAGDTVTRGQTLLVLEAMKMEHALAAPFDGVVAELSAEAGGQVSEGVVLARLEASA